VGTCNANSHDYYYYYYYYYADYVDLFADKLGGKVASVADTGICLFI